MVSTVIEEVHVHQIGGRIYYLRRVFCCVPYTDSRCGEFLTAAPSLEA